MPQPATVARPALRFVIPAKAALNRIPYFPQGIPAGFPSPADDHLQKALDLHEHLIKHPAATFFAHVQGALVLFVSRLLKPKRKKREVGYDRHGTTMELAIAALADAALRGRNFFLAA